MYYLAVRQFIRTLKNLDTILDKAAKHAQSKNYSPDNFVEIRLFPDMLPFAAQIRIVCDMAKATAANLSGKEAPKHEDNEKTFEELRGRVAKVLAYLETFTEADFAKTNAKAVVKVAAPKGKAMHADEYLFGRQIPNFFFHVTTAYNLLRKSGVELGKLDYLGNLNRLDA